jgi:hypothetical protein
MAQCLSPFVITGLVPVIHAFFGPTRRVDGRNESGHDDE